MRLILFCGLLLSSCSQIQLISEKKDSSVEQMEQEKASDERRDKTFEYQPQEFDVFSGKLTFVSFDTDYSEGMYSLSCRGESGKENRRQKVYIKDQRGKGYIAVSYFSSEFVERCYLNEHLVIILNIKKYPYKKEKLNVAKGKVDLSPKDLERVIREKKIKANLYKGSASHFLFDKEFSKPLDSFITSYYGVVRLFNNKKRSQHLGNDFRAAVGVPIPVSNRGRVVYTGNLFFSGNVVVVDHGLDIFTLYAHLSEIQVSKGDILDGGDIVGLAGKTGRVSGPHLHWGVKVNGHSVDGFSLVQESKKHFD